MHVHLRHFPALFAEASNQFSWQSLEHFDLKDSFGQKVKAPLICCESTQKYSRESSLNHLISHPVNKINLSIISVLFDKLPMYYDIYILYISENMEKIKRIKYKSLHVVSIP